MTRALVANLGQNVESQLPAVVSLSKIDAPFTTVVKRGKVTDFSNDLRPRMGIERLIFQTVIEVPNERGPNGEQVFKAKNDIHDQVRFVGNWLNFTENSGQFATSQVAGSDYLEVTFYGTGLNIVAADYDSTRDARATVDGGVEGANFMPASIASIINDRNYNPNGIIPVVSGLSLGLHTVKIRNVNWLRLVGFEFLNEATTIKTTPGVAYKGSKKYILSALDSQAYNSSFESGILDSARGGRVVMYLQEDGQVKKVLTPTNASQQNLTAADHTNEEVIRVINWREFGASRTPLTPDDFSLLPESSTNVAFTLEDGTTSLTGRQVDYVVSNNTLRMPSSTDRSIVLTFVGTGCDMVEQEINLNAITITVQVNGNTIGTHTTPTTSKKVVKLVSGLPYGTHTLRLTSTVGGTFGMHSFIIYGPKKPSIPDDAVELADYYLMADYADGNATSAVDNTGMPSGTLLKTVAREWVYQGTWVAIGAPDPATFPQGYNTAVNNVNGQPGEITFCGTGVMLHGSASAAGTYDFTLHIDGVLNASGVNVANASNLGGGSYRCTSTTSGAPCRLKITGLPFGRHTLRWTRTAGTGNAGLYSANIITPIHSPSIHGPGLFGNTAGVGSNAIGDSRVFAEDQDQDIPNWAQALGVSNQPSTTSTSYVPAPDMLVTLKTNGNPIEIYWETGVFGSTAGAQQIDFGTFVDGVEVSPDLHWVPDTSGNYQTIHHSVIVPVSAGTHIVQVYYRTSAGTATLRSDNRMIKVREL